MPLYKRPGSETWWVDIRRGRSGRVRRSTGTDDRAEAQKLHDEIAAGLWKKSKSGKQLSHALNAWLDAGTRHRNEALAIKQILKFYPDRALSEITEGSWIEAFGSKSPATYNRITNILRASLNLAAKLGWFDGLAPPKIDPRKPPKKSFRWLTRAEWAKVRLALAPHLRRMAEFAISTGLRWSNVAGLTWEQIDLKNKKAWVGAGETKGGKAIPVPLSAAALAALRATGSNRKGLVFPYEGRQLGSPKTGWAAAIKRAEVKPARWHDLRHTWASWHVQNGTPLMVLKELGGWSSLSQVQIYAHLATSHIAHYADNAQAPAAGRKQRSA